MTSRPYRPARWPSAPACAPFVPDDGHRVARRIGLSCAERAFAVPASPGSADLPAHDAAEADVFRRGVDVSACRAAGLDGGRAAVIVLGESKIEEQLERATKRANKLIEKQIDTDADELRREIEAAAEGRPVL